MRIIVDTNVLMSAILFGGTPARILQALREATVVLVMSPEIIDEYVRVAERLSARYPGIDVQRILALILQNAEWSMAVRCRFRYARTQTMTSFSRVRLPPTSR